MVESDLLLRVVDLVEGEEREAVSIQGILGIRLSVHTLAQLDVGEGAWGRIRVTVTVGPGLQEHCVLELSPARDPTPTDEEVVFVSPGDPEIPRGCEVTANVIVATGGRTAVVIADKIIV